MNDLKLIFGVGEIKRFDKQIKDAFNILKESRFCEGGTTTRNILRIKKLGFDHTHSSGETFIGKNQVIKMCLFTRRPPPLKYRVPTVIYAPYEITPRQWDWHFVIAIQPVIDTDEYLEDKWSNFFERKLSGVDAHGENYGLYKGEVKLFDW
jgi:hypothetical protein